MDFPKPAKLLSCRSASFCAMRHKSDNVIWLKHPNHSVRRAALRLGISVAIFCTVGLIVRLSDSHGPTPENLLNSLSRGSAVPNVGLVGSADLSGRVNHVRDGDTIEISGNPVRLANLDCAEAGTPAGNRATWRMRQLSRHTTISCDLTGRRSYDRMIGTCYLPDGRDLSRVLIGEGYCRM